MKKKTSIMLTDQDKKLLELLAKKEVRSQTKELEYLIRQRAEELGLKIEEQCTSPVTSPGRKERVK
jgi:hypothetical protein